MPTVDALTVTTATIPTDAPESDGTLAWDATTIVLVEVRSGATTGLGWTYGPDAAAAVVAGTLRDNVVGADALAIPRIWHANERAVRNAGRVGIAALAVSAVDIALWDLKARLLGVAVADLVGRFHEEVPVYGSGGFCSYTDAQLREQTSRYVELGIPRVKIKVGRDKDRDEHRCRVVREAIGPDVELYVDGNGAYGRQEALDWAHRFAAGAGVRYFEEPVSSDDLEGLRYLRDRVPASMVVAAGEYGWDLPSFVPMLDAVHVQQADVTRCGGITNLLRVGALCQAAQVPFSAHCAPTISAHACCGIQTLAHLEYFHDHVRIEELLFDGVPAPQGGALRPDAGRPGLGVELRRDVLSDLAAG
jgi:L-alanine-DL-glutamate epimerase-like enolase superfamily enzyme